jgi:hypothetical protein
MHRSAIQEYPEPWVYPTLIGRLALDTFGTSMTVLQRCKQAIVFSWSISQKPPSERDGRPAYRDQPCPVATPSKASHAHGHTTLALRKPVVMTCSCDGYRTRTPQYKLYSRRDARL